MHSQPLQIAYFIQRKAHCGLKRLPLVPRPRLINIVQKSKTWKKKEAVGKKNRTEAESRAKRNEAEQPKMMIEGEEVLIRGVQGF